MRYDDPNVGLSAAIGLVGAVVLFVVIVLLQAMFYRMEATEMADKVYTRADEGVRALDAEQLEILNSYGWIDEQAGVVRIPIDRAIELTVAEAQ